MSSKSLLGKRQDLLSSMRKRNREVIHSCQDGDAGGEAHWGSLARNFFKTSLQLGSNSVRSILQQDITNARTVTEHNASHAFAA